MDDIDITLTLETAPSITLQLTGTPGATGATGPQGPAGSSTLAGLTDVDLSDPTSGQVLTYNAAAGKWENEASGGGGGGASKGFVIAMATSLG